MLYPVTIYRARYGGAYEGAEWIAFHLDFDEMPAEANADDVTCANFFYDISLSGMPCGRGGTPNDALEDLERQLKQKGVL